MKEFLLMLSSQLHSFYDVPKWLKLQVFIRIKKSKKKILPTVFPHLRPVFIIFLYGLKLWVLLEITKFHLIKVCQVQVLFEGGPYMRNYGMWLPI